MASIQARHLGDCSLKPWKPSEVQDGCTCNPTFYVVVREGRKLHRERVGKNRRQAERALTKIQGQENEGNFQAVINIRFNDWGDRWLRLPRTEGEHCLRLPLNDQLRERRVRRQARPPRHTRGHLEPRRHPQEAVRVEEEGQGADRLRFYAGEAPTRPQRVLQLRDPTRVRGTQPGARLAEGGEAAGGQEGVGVLHERRASAPVRRNPRGHLQNAFPRRAENRDARRRARGDDVGGHRLAQLCGARPAQLHDRRDSQRRRTTSAAT